MTTITRMPEELPRRAVLGRLALIPFASAAGAIVATKPANAEHLATLAKIDAAANRYTTAQQAFETALTAYTASAPRPHWSIDYDRRADALCRRFAHNGIRFPAGPRMLPDERSLDDDHRDVCRKTREDDSEIRQTHARLTRRLKARAKRYRAQLLAHLKRYRLDDLQADCSAAERGIFDLAALVFSTPASTRADIHLQARMLSTFSAALGERQDWSTFQAGLFGRQLADSICRLEAA